MMRNKALLLTISCLLMACEANSYVVRDCVTFQSSNAFSAKYGYFSGSRNYKINISERKTIAVVISSLEGTLHIKVTNSETAYYEGNIDYDFNFTLNLDKGNYVVSLNSNMHKGSYSFSW